jgi:uncharacterized protein (TIGR03435 family)
MKNGMMPGSSSWNWAVLIVAGAASIAPCLRAQRQTSSAPDLTGTWQGTIHLPNRDAREVIRVSKDANNLKAVLFRIDLAPGQSFPSTPFALQGKNVNITFPAVGAFSGILSADGNSIGGTFLEGQMPFPLTLQRTAAENTWEIPSLPARPRRMATANPVFEVATVKPVRPGASGKGIAIGNRQISIHNHSLADLIVFSWGIHPEQLSGGDAWVGTERFDIEGKPEGDGEPDDRQLKSMIRALLADRFQLAVRNETKALSVYSIRVYGRAPRLTASTADRPGLPVLGFRGRGSLYAIDATIMDLAQMMQQNVVDRPVVDNTGLTGRYNFDLDWTPDEFQFPQTEVRPPATNSTDDRPGLFTAIQRQLGLKLEPAKTRVPILVIDHAEHPSEN